MVLMCKTAQRQSAVREKACRESCVTRTPDTKTAWSAHFGKTYGFTFIRALRADGGMRPIRLDWSNCNSTQRAHARLQRLAAGITYIPKSSTQMPQHPATRAPTTVERLAFSHTLNTPSHNAQSALHCWQVSRLLCDPRTCAQHSLATLGHIHTPRGARWCCS